MIKSFLTSHFTSYASSIGKHNLSSLICGNKGGCSSRVVSASYHFNLIANKKVSFASGGANRTQSTIYEQVRSRSPQKEQDDYDDGREIKEKPRVVNRNNRYLDRNEKRTHYKHAQDDGGRRRDNRRNNNKQRQFEEDDPWAEKPKVFKQLPPPELTRNKYITDDLEDHFASNKPKVKVPSFFANPSNSVQDVVKMKANVTQHIMDHKMKRGTIKHIKETKHSIEKNEDKIDSELSEILGGQDNEVLKNSKRFELVNNIAELDDNTLFDEIENEKIDLSQINLSPEENCSRLQTFYFSTLPEYIEECLLKKLKYQDSMTDSEYYKYLNMERLYISSAKLSEDYRTITLNYKLLVRENIDEIGEEAYNRDVQIIEQLFNNEFVLPTLETFEHNHGRIMLRDFEKPRMIKLCFKGVKKYEPSVFDEPLPEIIPGQRRQHINPFAELPYFTGKPLSGERIMNVFNNLGINIPEDSGVSTKNTDVPKSTRQRK